MNDEQVESFVVEAVSFGSAKIGRNPCERIANPLSSTDTAGNAILCGAKKESAKLR